MPARSKRYNEDRSGIVRCSWHGARLKGAYLHSVIVLVDATSVSTNRLSLSRSPFTDSFRKRSGKRETRRGRVELEIPIATEFVNSSSSLPSLLPSPTLPPLPLKIIHDRLPAVQRLPLALLFFPSPSLRSFPFLRRSTDPLLRRCDRITFFQRRSRVPLPLFSFRRVNFNSATLMTRSRTIRSGARERSPLEPDRNACIYI